MRAGDESIGQAQARSQPEKLHADGLMGWDGIGTWLACGVVSTGWTQPPSSFVIDASHGAADEWTGRVGRLFWNFSWLRRTLELWSCVELSELGDASNGCCHSTRHMPWYVSSARPLSVYVQVLFFVFSF